MVQPANSIEMFARKNCASLLLAYEAAKSTALHKSALSSDGRNLLSPIDMLFKCKDCDRRFATFQALGGHRASHVKLRLPDNHQYHNAVTIAIPGDGASAAAARPARFRIHECKECRERFPTGQALGGHMRKHAELSAKRKRHHVEAAQTLLKDSAGIENCKEAFHFQVLNESKKVKRVALDLDLNFPPLEDGCLLRL